MSALWLHGVQGGVSITSISRTTLGSAGEKATTVIYMALHYALLVACEGFAARSFPFMVSSFNAIP